MSTIQNEKNPRRLGVITPLNLTDILPTHYTTINSTAVVMTECTKLFAVCLGIILEEGSIEGLFSKLHREIVLMPYDFAKLMIPAALYTLLNNVAFVAISNLDAATYQVSVDSQVHVRGRKLSRVACPPVYMVKVFTYVFSCFPRSPNATIRF